jgi:hypothetical protein
MVRNNSPSEQLVGRWMRMRAMCSITRAPIFIRRPRRMSAGHTPARIGSARHLLDGWARANLSMSAVEWLCNKARVHRRNFTCDRRGIILDQ